jgi:hypothetical protein
MAHDLVFPHCSAALIHGGIGTVAECARAGLPTLVCSVSMDQPFWGHQIEQLGMGAHIRSRSCARTTSAPPSTSCSGRNPGQRTTTAGRGAADPDGVQQVCDVVEKTGTG